MTAQIRYNELVIPRAFQSPSLLKSILAWSASHQFLQYDQPGDNARLGIMCGEHVQSSLQSLQMEIRDPKRSNKVALIAACLMLCQQKLCLEKMDSKSWRIHLDGARMIMLAANRACHDDPDDLELLKMLNRWYQAIEALAALTTRGLSRGQVTFSLSSTLISISSAESEYLDEYLGYALKLNHLMREIGATALERRRQQVEGQHVSLSPEDFDTEADLLEGSVRRMMSQSQAQPPTFYPGVAGRLSPREIQDFVLSNEAYQHMAIIHIQRRIKKKPPSTATVQASVKRILKCGVAMTHSSQPSPWIASTGPFFTAGCDALGADQDTARFLLQSLYHSTRSESAQRALLLLESFWADSRWLDYYEWEALPGK
jgi:Fungal specific transcription factor domain